MSFAPSVLSVQSGNWANGPNNATAAASSNLADGSIHLFVGGTGPLRNGSPGGSASGTIGDLVTFDNTTGGVLDLGLTFSLHGIFAASLNPNSDPVTHDVSAVLQFQNYLGTTYPDPLHPGVQLLNPTNPSKVGAILGTAYTDYQYQVGNYNGGTSYYTNFTDNSGFGAPVALADLSTASLLNVTESTDLVIPTGLSYVDIGAFVNLSCSNAGTCDLSHTASLSFAPLPNGLSFTSDSGVFLAGLSSGVPEPSTWAMMVIGFAGLGFAGCRRRKAVRLPA